MTVTAVQKDPAALTMTVTAEFEASPDRVWQLWADPRARALVGTARTPPPSTRTTSARAARSTTT